MRVWARKGSFDVKKTNPDPVLVPLASIYSIMKHCSRESIGRLNKCEIWIMDRLCQRSLRKWKWQLPWIVPVVELNNGTSSSIAKVEWFSLVVKSSTAFVFCTRVSQKKEPIVKEHSHIPRWGYGEWLRKRRGTYRQENQQKERHDPRVVGNGALEQSVRQGKYIQDIPR